MLYLIRSYGCGKSSILKIGFTDDLEKRFGQYFYNNPLFEIISTREGDETLESLLHYYLYYLGYQFKIGKKLNEWFIDCPEIYQIFHISRERLERKLWKIRDKIFNSKLFSKEYKLFLYLYKQNKDNFEPSEFILNNGKVIKTRSKFIDRSFWEIYSKTEEYKTSRIIPEVDDESKEIVLDFLQNYFDKVSWFNEKMRLYCEFSDYYSSNKPVLDYFYSLVDDSDIYQRYYEYYGTQGCKAKKYQKGNLEEGILKQYYNDRT